MSNITNEKLEINRVPFSRMIKAEVAEFAKRATNIAEKHHIEGSVINPVIEELSRTNPQIEMLSVKYGIDPFREVLDNYKSQLNLTISRLKNSVKILSKSKNDKHLRVVDGYINTYLLNLDKSKNDKEMLQRVAGFLKDTDAKQDLTEAIESHELGREINQIKMVMSDLNATWLKRVAMLAERPNVETKDLVKDISTAVENLFKAVEVASIMSPEEDHTALALELSQLSDMFIRSMNIRRANNKRRADKKKELEDGADTPIEEGNPTEEGANPRPMATAMYAGNDWTNDWDDDDEEDNEEEFTNPFEVEEDSAEELHNNDAVVDDEEEDAFAVE